jgi:hypothetical protein
MPFIVCEQIKKRKKTTFFLLLRFFARRKKRLSILQLQKENVGELSGKKRKMSEQTALQVMKQSKN